MNRSLSTRPGLTLIELIVVLVILVGLAGIVIPLLPSMLGRTHTAAGATNMQEMTKWMQVYEQLYLKFPDEWDSLTDGTSLVSYLPNTGGSTPLPAGGQVIVHSLTDSEAASLRAFGINNVHNLATTLGTDQSPTFNPYANAVTSPTPVATGVKVAQLTSTAANFKLGLDINGTYLVFGMGKRCTMVGRTVTEAPVVSADEDAINPASYYGRFLIVVKVAQGAAVLPKAQFVGMVSLHPDQVDGAGQHIEEYYEIIKNAK